MNLGSGSDSDIKFASALKASLIGSYNVTHWVFSKLWEVQIEGIKETEHVFLMYHFEY